MRWQILQQPNSNAALDPPALLKEAESSPGVQTLDTEEPSHWRPDVKPALIKGRVLETLACI